MSTNKHTDCCLKIIDILNKDSGRLKNKSKKELTIELISNNVCDSNKAIENALRELIRLNYLRTQRDKLILKTTVYDKAKEQILNFKSGIPKENELEQRLENKYTISREELNDLFKDYSIQEMDQIILELQKKGFIRKIFGDRSRSKYYVIRGNDSELFITNPIKEIVSLFGDDLAFCYHTALQIHGLSRYAMSYEIFIDTKIPPKLSEISQYKIRSIIHPAESKGITKVKYGANLIRVTDKERTLIDCIHKPKYAVGWENVVYAINGLSEIDPEKVKEYLRYLKIPSLYSKVGYILELNRKKWGIDEYYLFDMKMFKPRNPVRFFKDNPGKYIESWNMFIPENLMEI